MYRYMDDYKSVGEFMDLDLLDHLGDAMLLNERLLFLGDYTNTLALQVCSQT